MHIMSHPLRASETAYNISKVFNFVVKASRLTQLVAKVAWPLKHIAQLLGTHTHAHTHAHSLTYLYTHNI